MRHISPFDHEEPVAAIIRCTADPTKVDMRTRSKWSRALRYALAYKLPSEPLDKFMKRKGGINCCASRFCRRLGRNAHSGLCARPDVHEKFGTLPSAQEYELLESPEYYRENQREPYSVALTACIWARKPMSHHVGSCACSSGVSELCC